MQGFERLLQFLWGFMGFTLKGLKFRAFSAVQGVGLRV